MAGRDVLTTRVGDMVKVEIKDRDNPFGSLPNYGNVQPIRDHGFHWGLASGESGTALTEQKAINAAARAIREHHARNAEAYIGINYSGGVCDNCDQDGPVIWTLHLANVVHDDDHQELCQNCLPSPMPTLPHRVA